MNQNNCVIAKYLGLGTIFVWDPTEIVTKMGDNCDLYYCVVEGKDNERSCEWWDQPGCVLAGVWRKAVIVIKASP